MKKLLLGLSFIFIIVSGAICSSFIANTTSKVSKDGATMTGPLLLPTSYVDASAVKINGIDVGTSSDSFWNATTGGIFYGTNVGVGVTTPTVKLDVDGDIKATYGINASTGVFSIEVKTSGQFATPILKAYDSQGLRIYDSSDNFGIFVEEGGNVGINNDNPEYNLDVIGTVYATGQIHTTDDIIADTGFESKAQVMTPNIKAYDATGLNFLDTGDIQRINIQETSGNIGISTGAATEKLEVIGNIKSTYGIIASTGVFSSSITIVGTATALDIVNNNFAYGVISSSYNSVAFTLSNVSYSTMTVGISSYTAYNITTSTTNGTITIVKAGLYDIFFAIYASGTNGNNIHGGLSINGVDPSGYRECSFTTSGAGNFSGVSDKYIVRLSVDDILSTQWKNETAANPITPKFYRLVASRLSS